MGEGLKRAFAAARATRKPIGKECAVKWRDRSDREHICLKPHGHEGAHRCAHQYGPVNVVP